MGPGDAELVTIKAARILKEADRVYCFDYLKDQVARYVPPERLSVVPFMLLGRLVGQSEKEAPANLREQVRRSEAEMSRFVPEVRRSVAAGKMLAFADAGDPTIFCPWSWILERFADLSPTVVPGLSSFNAANAALRTSITRHSSSILLTAGDDLGAADAKGRLNTTLVIFTHRAKVQDVVPRLAARYPADTPIAVVCEASYLSEKVVVATLGTILPKLADSKLPQLYLIYAGDALAAARRPAATGAGCPCGNVGDGLKQRAF
jgi:precorrin-4 methylase